MTADGSRQLAAEYSNKAAEYSCHWSPVIVPMALPLLDHLPLHRARVVLDIGCGTGAILTHIRPRATRALVVGIDLAEGMLRLARSHDHPVLVVSDAQQLPVISGTADAVLLVFVLFHMPDPAATLREASRVLTQDGVVGIVTWGRDPGLPGIPIWKEELDRAGAAPDPRDPAVMRQPLMDTPAKLHGLIEANRLAVVESWAAEMQHPWTVNELLATQVGCGLPARRLSSLDPARRYACQARVTERLGKLTASELVYAPEVLFVLAKRTARPRRGL